MPYHPLTQMTPIKTQAIQKAFEGNWDDAILLNKKLLKEIPNDIETLNRLALAFAVVGKIREAKSTYQKVLSLDDQNPIALKNVKRLVNLPKTNEKRSKAQTPQLLGDVSTMFLEEHGKTKVLELVNVAEPKIILRLMTGESVELYIKRLKIFVLDTQKKYIGMLPDDVGKRLIRFIRGGNTYKAYIKAIANHKVIIFIREIKRVSRFKNQPSFIPADKNKISFSAKSHPEKDEEVDEEESAED